MPAIIMILVVFCLFGPLKKMENGETQSSIESKFEHIVEKYKETRLLMTSPENIRNQKISCFLPSSKEGIRRSKIK